MTIHHRRLKQITFSIGDESASPSIPDEQFECQIKNWQVVNNTEDGERIFTFCPDGEDREEADDDYALELTYFADWRENGISDFLQTHDGQWLDFVLDHHPDIEDEHVRWSGRCKVKAPTVGGEVRATEEQTVTYQIKGKPDFERVESP